MYCHLGYYLDIFLLAARRIPLLAGWDGLFLLHPLMLSAASVEETLCNLRDN